MNWSARRRARAESLSKTGEPFDVGPVTLTKQPMEWDYPDVPMGPRFKSKYRVEFAGRHCGWIVVMNGWGKPWELWDVDERYVASRSTTEGGRDALAALVPQLLGGGDEP